MKKLLLALSLAALLLTASGFAANENSNRRAPGWALPDTDFKFHDLMDFRGKVVLLDFMQTSCPHCNESTSNLKAIAGRYGQKVVLIHVVNPPSSMQDVKNFKSKHLLSSPILFDSGQVAASYLQITPSSPGFDVPHVFVIDSKGTIVNDFGWSDANKPMFLGNGLVPILDKLTK